MGHPPDSKEPRQSTAQSGSEASTTGTPGEISTQDIEALARLAHLKLSPEECERFASQLAQIIRYAESIQDLDTEGVEPTSHALLRAAALEPLRPDVPHRNPDGDGSESAASAIDRERLLERAPQNGDGLFKVPKVLP